MISGSFDRPGGRASSASGTDRLPVHCVRTRPVCVAGIGVGTGTGVLGRCVTSGAGTLGMR
jgi:hypothetical protein